MISGDLDQINLHAVWVLDPHLDQSPGLGRWPSQNAHAGRSQPLCLSANIPDLKPEHQRASRRAANTPGHLQESRAQEEHHPRIIHRSELPVNRKTQHVAVEMAAPPEVGGAQQNPAAQYVHAAILAARARAGRIGAPVNADWPGPLFDLKVVQTVYVSHPGSREQAGHSLHLCLIAASKLSGT